MFELTLARSMGDCAERRGVISVIATRNVSRVFSGMTARNRPAPFRQAIPMHGTAFDISPTDRTSMYRLER